jgi:hypothetical protein
MGFVIGAVLLYIIIRMAVGDSLRSHHRWLAKRYGSGALPPDPRSFLRDER